MDLYPEECVVCDDFMNSLVHRRTVMTRWVLCLSLQIDGRLRRARQFQSENGWVAIDEAVPACWRAGTIQVHGCALIWSRVCLEQ